MAYQEICKSNALIEASYTLSVAEQRIILACIAQLDHGSPVVLRGLLLTRRAAAAPASDRIMRCWLQRYQEHSTEDQVNALNMRFIEPRQTITLHRM
ncbi:replication initiation protein [Pseudomonas sp. 21LCFQ02]|nr:RepB family plasmid replication initiator protein [Pseudomonas sp. 21LCFQ02]MCO8171002.1 replication initiation protein [Pseudomonas sp. 21LCFQ02]